MPYRCAMTLLLLGAALLLTSSAGCDGSAMVVAERTWQTVLDELPSGLLAVSGTGPEDVYIVGTDADDGNGPLFMHYDGVTWRRMETGVTGDLWWISAERIDGHFYLSGENGMILRFDPEQATITPQITPGSETIFGIWGFSHDDIWAVGGDLQNQQFGGTIWHYDGVTWSEEDLGELFPDGYPTAFKIWGRSPDEVFVVGAAGLILQYDGQGWVQLPTGMSRAATLISVYGNADTVVAVGGFNNAVILEKRDGDFADRASPATIQMNGVYLNPDGSGVAVGRELGVAVRTESGWEVQSTNLPLDRDFHADWIDSEGGVWAVGGVLIAEPINRGILVYYGPSEVSGTIDAQVIDTGNDEPDELPSSECAPPCEAGEVCMDAICVAVESPAEPRVELGLTDVISEEYTRLEDGDALPYFTFGQGGSHTYVTVRVEGMTPAEDGKFDVTYQVIRQSDGFVLSEFAQTPTFESLEDGSFEARRRLLFLLEFPELLNGEIVDLAVGVGSSADSPSSVSLEQTFVLAFGSE